MSEQRTLSEYCMARRPTSTAPETKGELRERAKTYARTVDIDVDVEAITWEVSDRAKRRSGVCIYDRRTEGITIRLTWAAYREYGWEEFRGTIRHELVHVWEFQQFETSSHGRRFKRKTREIEAPRQCRSFTDARLRLVCTKDACTWEAGRHRASEAVTEPERRWCGACRSRYAVEHVATGETWKTAEGYENARARIGEEW